MTTHAHEHHRRPGTWGAGFVVPDAAHPDGFVVHTFEHPEDEDGVVRRRRISTEAATRGFAPCSPYRQMRARDAAYLPRRPAIRYCFEIAPDDSVYPHLRGHPEWVRPERERVVAVLARLGLRIGEDDDD